MLRLKTTYLISALFLASFSAQVSAQNGDFQATDEGFNTWVTEFKETAKQQGISSKTINRAFKNIKLNKGVLKSDREQPEFTETFYQYYAKSVSKKRIQNGIKYHNKYRKLLDQVTAKYGVPGRYIIALWGLETNYGSYTGKTPIIESLATLAYDPRRSEFFTKELLSALKIVDKGHVPLRQMKGSWAGAMGQVQFMPSNYLKFGVDGDGDGKVNLWNSVPDAFHSAGNFLKQNGWKAGDNWGREVLLPERFNYGIADNKITHPLTTWRKLNVTKIDGSKLPRMNKMKARMVLAEDHRGPAFLVYDNFQVFKRWNNANKYALAAGLLSNRIVGYPALTIQKAPTGSGLSRSKIKSIQVLLNAQGYDSGKPDGVIGSKTRKAIRTYQTKNNMPADGFPSLELLKALKK